MTMPRPTFADVNEDDLIQNGTYHAKIRKFETREPKDTRKEDLGDGRFRFWGSDDTGKEVEKFPYDNVDFVIQDEGPYFGRHIFCQLTWAPGRMYLTRQLNAALHIEGDENESPGPDDYINKDVMIVVTTQKGQKGYPDRNNVQKIMEFVF